MSAAEVRRITDPQPQITVETITPELARQYLGYNTHNRKLRPHKILAYAADMREGRWEQNGDAIRFSASGALHDGQHRLLAVIESDTPITTIVVRGLTTAAQDTIDTGAPRKFSDVLSLRGEQNGIPLAAAIRSVFIWQKGIRIFSGGVNSQAATIPQLLICFERNEWIREEIPLLQRLSSHAKLPVTVSGALVYAFNKAGPDDAPHFWDRLMSDEGHVRGDPIYTLRKTLLASKDHRGTRNTTYLAAITVKAWNKYLAGEKCDLLRYSPGGANPEKFPEVHTH